MGERSRRDPAGHPKRGKGQPTPQAPQNGQPPAQAGPPPTQVVAWVVGVQAQVAKHPAIEGDILTVHFLAAGGAIIACKMPATDGWDAVVEAVENAKADYASARSRIVVPPPGGVDLRAEAEAQRKLREGPDHA